MRRGFHRLMLCSLLSLWLLAGCGWSGYEQKMSAGKEVYTVHCSHCHQPEGQGYAQVYPPLAGNPIVKLSDAKPVIEIVLHGRGGMPGYLDDLTGEERAQVITYIRGAWNNNAPPITTSEAQ